MVRLEHLAIFVLHCGVAGDCVWSVLWGVLWSAGEGVHVAGMACRGECRGLAGEGVFVVEWWAGGS